MTKAVAPRRILEGLRVVDMTQFVAGPYCARMLADLGANVVRIDQPSPLSSSLPSSGAARLPPRRAEGPASLNLGKRSICLDLKHPDGVIIAKALAEQGRAGVPLYLVYGIGGRAPVILPQLLTEGAVIEALEAAAKP